MGRIEGPVREHVPFDKLRTCFDTVARPDLLSTYGVLSFVELNRLPAV